MPKVKVPRGWKRSIVGRKIVYDSDKPRVRIWKRSDFEDQKRAGRFGNIEIGDLDFSIKVENETSDEEHNMQEDLDENNPAMEPLDLDERVEIDIDNNLGNIEILEHQATQEDENNEAGLERRLLADSTENQAERVSDHRDLDSVQRLRDKVENSVKQMTNNLSTALNHGTELKNASAMLNNLRNSNFSDEISLDHILEAIQSSNTSR